MTELPKGWAVVPLDDLVSPGSHSRAIGPFGSNLKVTDYRDEGVPLVFVRNIRARDFDVVPTFVSEAKAAELVAHTVEPGDVLITKMGDPPGDTAIYPGGRGSAILTADCIKATPHPEISGGYLSLAIESPACALQVGEMTSGVAQQKVSLGKMRKLQLPVAPLAEQERIVAAIEEAFSKLDAGESGLHTVRQLLKRMRDAVLAAAVTGRLVSQDATDTPATKLLADLGAEAVDPPASELTPSGWAWSLLGDVTEIGGGIQKQPNRAPSRRPVPFLRVANVGRGTLDLHDVHLIEAFDGELARYGLRAGDLLVVEGNGSADQIGRAALWGGAIEPCVHQNHLIRVRPTQVVLPAFLELYWNSPGGSHRVQSVASSTSGLHTLSTGKLKSLPVVVVPPVEEQARVVAEVERQLTFLDVCERTTDAELTRSAALRRSVLKSAFEGRLAPQDPSDEPASVLLDRIRADREVAPKPARRARRTA